MESLLTEVAQRRLFVATARLAVPASEERYPLERRDRPSEEESAAAAHVSSVDDDDCGGVLLPRAGSQPHFLWTRTTSPGFNGFNDVAPWS